MSVDPNDPVFVALRAEPNVLRRLTAALVHQAARDIELGGLTTASAAIDRLTDLLREFGQMAVAAERQRCAEICEAAGAPRLAAEIRGRCPVCDGGKSEGGGHAH